MGHNRHIYRNLALITQIGITMMTSIGLCTAFGIWMDNKCNTNFLILYIVFGIAVGFRSVYAVIKKFNDEESKDEKN